MFRHYLRSPLAITLALFSQIAAAEPLPQMPDEIHAGRIGEYSAGAAPREALELDMDAVRAASEDTFIGKSTVRHLNSVKPDRPVRGAKEAQIYKRYVRSIVLIATDDGLGSGSLINSNGDILTNWHVVEGYTEVAVIFKPANEGRELQRSDVRRAKVIRIDEVADLALLRVDEVPSGIEPLPIGDMSEVSVGGDVHAIGHPTGEAWTYTKGVVSQMRQDYEWAAAGDGKTHRATVIQTQTPINPGNSGGPLINDAGKLIGVNSFKAKGEGLNFAVAADEVRRFLLSSTNRIATSDLQERKSEVADACRPRELYKGPSEDDTNELLGIDLDCDGKPDAELRKPYDIRKPIILVFDENKDSIPDTLIFDLKRRGKWDYSLRDTTFVGRWDLACEHADGELEPTRCEPYTANSEKG